MASAEFRRIAAIEAARQRRVATATKKAVQVEWFLKEIVDKVNFTMKQRVRLATEFVKNQIIRNISRPVTKTIVSKTVRVLDKEGVLTNRTKTFREIVVSDRSKPGEFPKADTTLLMKSIFSDYKNPKEGDHRGFVGTPLDYGLKLELKMNRSFLRRTLNEQRDKVVRILTGPIT